MNRRRVVHLLPGLWLPPEARAAPGDAVASPVRRLGRWLGQARPSRASGGMAGPGWEPALARLLGYRQPDSGWISWLAQPVQLTPGMKDLVAHPLDAVQEAEREALWAAAEPDLQTAGARLKLSTDGLWLLQMEAEGEWQGSPPSVGLGRPMAARSPGDAAGRRLQVLTNALQMAWFQHPVNLAREQERRPPVQSLWLWSPGHPAEVPAVRRVCGGGPVARWLAAGAEVEWIPDPAAEPAATGDTGVVVEALGAPASPQRREELLASVSEDVVAPKIRSLRQGVLASLQFIDPQIDPRRGERAAGPRLLILERRDLLAFWRRSLRP